MSIKLKKAWIMTVKTMKLIMSQILIYSYPITSFERSRPENT